MNTILKNVRLLPEYGYGEKPVCVVVKDKKIAEITEKMPENTEGYQIVDGREDLLIPAFYNAHSHIAMTLFRGYGEDLPLQRWLDERILPAEELLTYDSVYHASMWAIAEMLKAGIASFSDMYMFVDATAEAVLETGIKANLSRSVVSFDPDADPSKEYRVIEALKLAERYHGRDDGRLLIDLALHAEYTNVPSVCSYMAEQAARLQTGMQIHLSETQHEHAKCIERWGKTPTAFFYDTGVLDVPTVAAHGVFLTDEDIAILAEKKATVAHNPVSNLKLGSGVMPLRRLLDGGVNVALGSDGTASNNRLDILRELQYAALIHKGVNRDPAIVPSKEIFRLATKNGALAQRRSDCGEIRVGNRADLVLLDRHSIHNIPSYDDYAMIAYSAQTSDVRMTMVDGRILYQDGAYTCIDEERLRYNFQETLAHYFQ